MILNCCLCYLACLSALLINSGICIGTFYKLSGKNDDVSMSDENVPFLTQSFFSCESNKDCAQVAKTKEGNGFKEVLRQQTVEANAVVFKKVKNPKSESRQCLKYSLIVKANLLCFD